PLPHLGSRLGGDPLGAAGEEDAHLLEGLADGGDHEGSLALARGFHLDLASPSSTFPPGKAYQPGPKRIRLPRRTQKMRRPSSLSLTRRMEAACRIFAGGGVHSIPSMASLMGAKPIVPGKTLKEELALARLAHVTTRIRDPIHGSILLDARERQVIDAPFFQRLRWIRQMGFADAAFPGATHTRYVHALGACHVSGLLFDAIQRRLPRLKESERSRLRAALRLAVLLH